MNVLVVCDRFPVSMQDGLTLRLRHIVRALNGRHRFDLLCLDRGVDAMDSELSQQFDRIVRVPWPEASDPPAGRLRRLLDASANYPRSVTFKRALEQMLQVGSHDLVCDFGANLPNVVLPVLRHHPRPLLVDQVDDSLVRLRRDWEQDHPWRRRAGLLLHMAQERYWARRHIGRAQVVVLATERDAASFRRSAPQSRTVVVGNGVDTSYFGPKPGNGEPPVDFDMVFEGAMDFQPNVDAASRLVHQVLPLLQRTHPQARVLLVGRKPAAAVQALAGPNVQVTGTVPDVRPWLSRARVFVCPMQLGAGIKNKLLQAWATGLPIVASSCAAEGLQARDGENILIRESAAEVAAAVAGLLADPAAAERLGQAGRAEAVTRHSWGNRALDFESAMRAAVAAQQSRAG